MIDNEKLEDVLCMLDLARAFNSKDSKEKKIGFGFDVEAINEILECLSDSQNIELVDTMENAKNILSEHLSEHPDEGTHVTRIRLTNELIDKIFNELGPKKNAENNEIVLD